MNWRTTAVLGALVALLAGVYLLSSPPPGTAPGVEDKRLLPEFRPEQVEGISIARKDGPEIRVERAKDAAGEYWRLRSPVDHPADAAVIQQLLFALDRFVKTTSFEPGRPEAAPSVTGLAEPRIRVTWKGLGKEVLLGFGQAPPTNSKAVFVQRQGDPKVYLVDIDTFEQFNKPAWQYRSKSVLRYPAHAVVRVELQQKFLRKQAKDRPERVEYERSLLERIEVGTDRGWWMLEPHREKVDDHKLQYLVRVLAELEASEFQPAGDLKAKELDEPQDKVALYLNGVAEPVRLHFGGSSDGGRRRWIHAPGTGETARIEEAAYAKLPVQRKHVRSDAIFSFSQEQVKTLEVDAGALGKVRVERRETKKEGEPVPEVSWVLLEPAGLRIEKERLELFVTNIMTQRIQDWLGAQDFKLVRLEPADVTLTAATVDGKTLKYGFGAGSDGYLRKEGVAEVFVVRPELVKILQRLELNFLHPEVFNVPRDGLREFAFESRDAGRLEPLFYRLSFDPGTKVWRFTDPKHASEAVDEARLGGLLTMLNYIKAETFIAKDAQTSAKHRLDPAKAPARLSVKWEGGPAAGVEFLISEDLSDKPTRPVYYARRADEPSVFQINALLVENLKRAPVLKK